jgi:hypothetical protein
VWLSLLTSFAHFFLNPKRTYNKETTNK